MSKDKISVDLAKVEAGSKWPQQTTVSDIQSFLGLVGYYKRSVEGFSKIASPFTNLTRKNVKLVKGEAIFENPSTDLL